MLLSAIKVTNRSGAEVSLYDQVKVLKGKYERLQARTVPIAEELGAYARLSEVRSERCIVFNQPGLTPTSFSSRLFPLKVV